MQGIFLKLFVPEATRHHSDLLYEWILKQAELIGMPGGTALRTLAAFGRHGHLHEQHFFELAGELPITLEFFATDLMIEQLLALLVSEKHSMFYIKFHAEAGLTV